MAAKIVAFINYKGGVAKTTTTVGLAEILSTSFYKNVLVIDLDPQTNATVMLIGDEKWHELNKRHATLATLFNDAVYDKSDFDLSATLQKSVGKVKGSWRVDLLPSSMDLIDLQDYLVTMPRGLHGTKNPVDILRRGAKDILHQYDYVLIDCPPNLGHITLNGLKMSDGYIIPTIPDYLSTYGIPQIVTRIADFSEEIEKQIVPLGIVATKVRDNTILHSTTLETMRKSVGDFKDGEKHYVYPYVFKTFFKETIGTAKAGDYNKKDATFKQVYGSINGNRFDSFAGEFINACREV